ncbi:MAG: hypothetical protein QN213_12645 [Armatimonadota bacterium]|nr:hypothetical protein [Armatimonadota bacterium]MDR7610129.1 hypothetical protein [Armatimonadota bacterium]
MDFTAAAVERRVAEFDARYGPMEKVLWCLRAEAVRSLSGAGRPEVLREFVRTVRNWWGVRGVSSATLGIMTEALQATCWTPEAFEPSSDFSDDVCAFAVGRVSRLVDTVHRKGGRREWSLSAKVLHWLMPWRVPAYDSFVRQVLKVGIQGSDDQASAYREVVSKVFNMATRLMGAGRLFFGELEPRSPLRALDKYLWMEGGGAAGRALVVRDPERVLRELGLTCPPAPSVE